MSDRYQLLSSKRTERKKEGKENWVAVGMGSVWMGMNGFGV